MQLQFAGYNATLLLNENLVINGTLVPLGTILGGCNPREKCMGARNSARFSVLKIRTMTAFFCISTPIAVLMIFHSNNPAVARRTRKLHQGTSGSYPCAL